MLKISVSKSVAKCEISSSEQWGSQYNMKGLVKLDAMLVRFV
jgi:hypothetical protein